MSGMQNYAALLARVGLLSRDMDDLEIYSLAGRVIHDDFLTRRSLKFLVGGVLPTGSRLKAVEEMTHEERLALRDRLSVKVLPFIRKEDVNKNRAEQMTRAGAKEEAALESEEDS